MCQYGWKQHAKYCFFLAINYVLNQYPTHQIILHNFSFQGWSGHDWHNEKCLVQTLLDKRKIKFL